MHADDGRGSLRDRLPAPEPPGELAERVRATLESRGLVRQHHSGTTPSVSTRSRSSAWITRLGLVAAGVLLGVLARSGLSSTGGRPAGAAVAGQYVLLLYGDAPDDTGSVHLAREREYGRWASQLTGGVRWVAGHELGDVIERLGPQSAGVSVERLAGYFVIDAPSRARAAEVARTCPHLRYGGRVVLMEIEANGPGTGNGEAGTVSLYRDDGDSSLRSE